MDLTRRLHRARVPRQRPRAALVLSERQERDERERVERRAHDEVPARLGDSQVLEERRGIVFRHVGQLLFDLRRDAQARRTLGLRLRAKGGIRIAAGRLVLRDVGDEDARTFEPLLDALQLDPRERQVVDERVQGHAGERREVLHRADEGALAATPDVELRAPAPEELEAGRRGEGPVEPGAPPLEPGSQLRQRARRDVPRHQGVRGEDHGQRDPGQGGHAVGVLAGDDLLLRTPLAAPQLEAQEPPALLRGDPRALVEDEPRLEAWHVAYTELGRRLTDPAAAATFKLGVGDAYLTHAHRVLHGRTAFSAGGARCIRDAYFEFDNVLAIVDQLTGEVPE